MNAQSLELRCGASKCRQHIPGARIVTGGTRSTCTPGYGDEGTDRAAAVGGYDSGSGGSMSPSKEVKKMRRHDDFLVWSPSHSFLKPPATAPFCCDY